MVTMIKASGLAFALFLGTLALGCGGGGGGGSSNPAPINGGDITVDQLTGTWFGTLEDDVGGMHLVEVTVSGSSITSIVVDGTPQNNTGTIAKESTQVFSYILSDGTEGGFFIDPSATYLAFVNDWFEFGVLQKGATALPAYTANDLNGSWSGVTVLTDFITFTQYTSSANCASLTCNATASNGVSSTASFNGPFDASYGRWMGTYTNSASSNGQVNGFLSPDKQFAGTWACDTQGGFIEFPDGCDFSAWKRTN